MGLIQLVEGLKRKDQGPWKKKEFYPQTVLDSRLQHQLLLKFSAWWPALRISDFPASTLWATWLKSINMFSVYWYIYIDGETMETMADFIFLGSKITADCDCSHETKRRLLLGRKVMTNLYSILKSRDFTLPTKVCPVKAMVLPIVMYGCELDYKGSWVPKNWCFWTVMLLNTLESPLDRKEIKWSVLKEISPEYSLERLMLKLKLQYFGHLLRRTDSL